MKNVNARPPGLSIDRQTGRISTDIWMDRLKIAFLDAYAKATRPFHQRGLYKACRLIGKTWQDREATLVLGSDAQVTIAASDPYWNRMLLSAHDHEPGIARMLHKLRDVDYSFVDCGANIGYWSVFAASTSCGGGKPVLAVEASARTFVHLAENSAPYADRIKAIHRAILDRSGVEVRLNNAHHEARGIAGVGETADGEQVTSITIDDLIAVEGWSKRRLVIKLDIEGVEREALMGMEQAFRRDPLVIYEDHGSDRTHGLTRHMLNDRRLQVHLLLDDRLVRIGDADQLDVYKTDPTDGYDLVAIKPNSAWLPYIESQTEIRPAVASP